LGCLTIGSAQTGLSAFGALDTVSKQSTSSSVILEQGENIYQVNGKTVDSLAHQNVFKIMR
jgi:hypothetical protein